MKVTIQKTDLVALVETVRHVAARSSSTFALQCLLLETQFSFLQVTGTNLDVAMRAKREAHIQERGSIAIPAGRFWKIVQELPDGLVCIESANHKATIRAGALVVQLMCGDPKTFLPWPNQGEVNAFFEFSGPALAGALQKVAPFVTDDLGRYALRSVLFEAKSNWVRLVASDGRRISVDALWVPLARQFAFCVPADAAAHVLRACQGQIVQVNVEGNLVYLFGEGVELVAKLSETDFPDWRQALPAGCAGSVEVKRSDLLAALGRVRLCAAAKVRLRFEAEELELFADSFGVGEATEKLLIDFAGVSFAACYNVEYLIEALQVMGGECVRFDLPHLPDQALKLVDSVGEYFHVLMPIKNT